MPKLSSFKLGESRKAALIKQFWFAISEINEPETVEAFLRRLLTPTEILMLSKRLDILKYLVQGSSYDQIKRALNVTDSTIARLNNLLQDEDPAFLKVLVRLIDKEKDRLEKENSKKSNPYKSSKKVWP